VGRRAKLLIETEQQNMITAIHDGYTSSFGVTHRRKFEILLQGGIRITDSLLGQSSDQAVARFHFDHAIQVLTISQGRIELNNGLVLDIQGADHCELGTYQQALGYNLLMSATVLTIQFTKELTTTIY
jgi:hypothetical protein